MSEERDKLRNVARRLARLAKRTSTTLEGAGSDALKTEKKTTEDRSTRSKRNESQA